MFNKYDFYLFFCFYAFIFIFILPSYVNAAPVIRVSTENSEDHPQTQALKDFVALANQRFKGELLLELFPTGKLFRGSDVVNAVSAGRMEIAVPGYWHMSKFVPDLNLFLLPRFYGVHAQNNYEIRDGAIGKKLSRQIEDTLNVHLLGRWIDLGYAHIFTSHKQVKNAQDMNGLLLRVAGGLGNSARIEALGGKAVVIPWPDFSDALKRNAVDGTLTTAATITSVNLWESGIKYAYLDKEYFPQYIPIVSNQVWNRLTEKQRDILVSSWDDIVDTARMRAQKYQEDALKVLKEHSVIITTPSDDEIKGTREKLLVIEPELIKKLRISVLD